MKKLLSASVALATLTMGLSTPALADVSATAGFLSDYVFRGNALGDSSAQAAIDYTMGGFYAGVWTVDDGGLGNNGLETDYYAGYNLEVSKDLKLKAGFTDYQYSYTADNEFEINLGAYMGMFSLDIAKGTDTNNTSESAAQGTHLDEDTGYDYTHILLGVASANFSARVGNYKVNSIEKNVTVAAEGDKYSYVEVGANGEVSGANVSITLGRKTGINIGGTDVSADGTEYLVFGLTKSFTL